MSRQQKLIDLQQMALDHAKANPKVAEAMERIAQIEDELDLLEGWQHDYLPSPEKDDWRIIGHGPTSKAWSFGYGRRQLTVFASVAIYEDRQTWMHISVSTGRKQLPTWDDLVRVRDGLVGAEQLAVQVLPPKASHVNLAPVLHLWVKLTGEDPVPDFTMGSGSI